MRKIYEDEVQALVVAGQEKIAKARFAVLGTNIYPDATFTLRLSYGAVRSWIEKGQQVEPFTKLSRLYERTTGKDPFRLPQRWLDARSKLDPNTPFNYVTTNDIVGGNSGSPVVDAQGRLVGLAFDGNIHSIAGSYWYDEKHEPRGRGASRASSSRRCARCTAPKRSRRRSSGEAHGSAIAQLALLRHDRELDVQAVLHFERAERHAERLDAELGLQDVELAARASASRLRSRPSPAPRRRGSRP